MKKILLILSTAGLISSIPAFAGYDSFKAGDFGRGGIGVCKQILSIVDNIGGGRYYLHAL